MKFGSFAQYLTAAASWLAVLVRGDAILTVLRSRDLWEEIGLLDTHIIVKEHDWDLDLYSSTLTGRQLKISLSSEIYELFGIFPNTLIVLLDDDVCVECIVKKCPYCPLLLHKVVKIPDKFIFLNSQLYQVEDEPVNHVIKVYELYKANERVISSLILKLNSSSLELITPVSHMWDRRKDLLGTHLRVIGSSADSLIGLSEDNNSFEGPFVDILNYLAKQLNFTYSIVLEPNNIFGSQDVNGTWNGRIAMLLNDEGDFIMAGLSINRERIEVIDYGPILTGGYTTFAMLDPFKYKAIDYSSYINIFTALSWLCYAGFVIILTFMYIILLSAYNSKLRSDSLISMTIRKIAPSILLLSSDVNDALFARPSVRILLFTIWMMFFFVFQMYSSGLTSLMTANDRSKMFRSFRDLYDQGYELNLLEGTSYHMLLERAPPGNAYHDFYRDRLTPEHLFITYEALSDGTVNNPNSALMGIDTFENYSPLLTNMGRLEDSVVEHLAPGFPKNSQYRELLSYHIFKMVESGLVNRIYKKWDITEAQPDLKPTPFQSFPLELNHVAFLMAILLAGIFLSFLTALVEKLYVTTCATSE